MSRGVVAAALAALVASAGPACAQQLGMYGRLYPEVVLTRMSGATAAGSTGLSTLSGAPTGDGFDDVVKMDASNSRLGLRGEEPLGGGLRAVFQIEQRIEVDTGNAPGNGIASRDTFVGLAGNDFGLVKLGNFDTVYKTLGDTLSFLGVSSGNFVSNSGVLAKQGFGASSAGSFHLRRANSTWYETPQWRGLQWLVQYSPDEVRASGRNAWLLSTGVKLEAAQTYAALAAEVHRDTFGGSRNVPAALSNIAVPGVRARDASARATLQQRFGAHAVEGNVAYTRYRETGVQAGRFASYGHWSGALSADTRWPGAWRTAVSLVYSGRGTCTRGGGAACSTDGLQGFQLALGAAYALSGRTSLFGLYAKLWNGRSATYNNMDGIDVAIGADTRQLALGISHAF